MEEKKLKKQQAVFATVCKALDEMKFDYEKDDEQMVLSVTVIGDDLSIPVIFCINKDYDSLIAFSTIPFKIVNEKVTELMFAINVINSGIPSGDFYIDMKKGKIVYRNDLLFEDSIISEKTISGMINLALNIIDLYNDKLMALNNNIISMEEFINKFTE